MEIRQHTGNSVVMLKHVSRECGPIEPFEVQGPRLKVNIVFTGMEAVEIAMKRAAELATDLEATTRLIVPYVVPYRLELEHPDVPLEFTCTKLQLLAASSGVDPYIHVYLCRDAIKLLHQLLPAGSIVVLCTKKPWSLPARAERIARALRRSGCEVILVRR